MLFSIRKSFGWRSLFQRAVQRRPRSSSPLTRIEHLESRVVLSATVAITETYRDFDFNVTGSANGHTIIPGGFFGDTYHDNYNINLIPELSSGSVSFSSPTAGSGFASTSVEGSGVDSFGPYPIAYSGSGNGSVDDGELFDFFIFSPYPSDNFTKTGHFDSGSWSVSTSWSGAVFDADTGAGDGTTSGSFGGFVNQDDIDLTDFNVTIDFNTAQAEAIHDSDHSINQVAERVTATIRIEVTGQHMKSGSMGTPATYAHVYLGGFDAFHKLIDPVPIHWNTGTVTIELADFLPATVDDGKLYVVLDEEGAVPELDETNNQVEFPIPYDLEVAGLGWINDGSVLAAFRIAEPGLSTGVIGGTFAEIFFADANNNYLDAFPETPDIIDPLAAYSIGALSSPQATNGDFLLFTFPLAWRPVGATQITALIDLFAIPHNADINPANNFLSLPLTELSVTNPVWNENGSLDFNVDVSNAPVFFDTTVTIYWGSGDLADPSLTTITQVSLPKGSSGSVPFHIGAGTIGMPPAGTDALVILPDTPDSPSSFGEILEPIENDVALLPPNPLDLEFIGIENVFKSGTVKPDDVDAGTYQIEPAAGPAHGSVNLLGDGSFVYFPAEDFVGDDQFDYYIQGVDGRSLAATVTIHVLPFNASPLTQHHEYQIQSNTPFAGTLSATDDEGDDLTFRLNVAPEHGTVVILEDGSFTYEPGNGYVGVDGFSFIANDRFTDSLPGIIGFSIEAANTAPSIDNQTFDVDEVALFGTFVGTVLADDPEGDDLSFAIAEGNTDGAFAIDPASGEITVSNSAALQFAIHPTFTMTVVVTDNGSPQLSSTAVITIDLNQASGSLSLSASGGAVGYRKKQPLVAVLSNVVVQGPGIGGGRLVISIDLMRGKRKAVDTISGFEFGGLLGVVTGPTTLSNGRTQVSIDLIPEIEAEHVQAFLRNLKFSTISKGIKIAHRTVRVQLFDADGNASNLLVQTINLTKK